MTEEQTLAYVHAAAVAVDLPLVPRLLAGGIITEIIGAKAELRSDELDHLGRDQFARSQHREPHR